MQFFFTLVLVLATWCGLHCQHLDDLRQRKVPNFFFGRFKIEAVLRFEWLMLMDIFCLIF